MTSVLLRYGLLPIALVAALFQPAVAQPAAPSPTAEPALPVVQRISGRNRVATAIAASRQAYPDGADTVVIAAAGRFADALAAVPLAHSAGAPLLLVDGRADEPVLREVRRLGAQRALLVAAFGAVPVVVELELLREGVDVERIAGDGRFHTAARLARATGPADSGEAVVASGAAFADALAAGPLAAVAGLPLLLTSTEEVPPDTAAVLAEFAVSRTFVIGGRQAIPADAAQGMPGIRRVSGPDRYATSVAVARRLLQRGGSLSTVAVATGRDFADALAAGAFVAKAGGPLLLVDGQEAANAEAVFAFLAEQADAIGRVVVFGGDAAVSEAVEARIAAALEGGG
jgi:putative cell wall-binding protein